MLTHACIPTHTCEYMHMNTHMYHTHAPEKGLWVRQEYRESLCEYLGRRQSKLLMSFSWVVSGILVLFTTSINSNTLILIRFYNVKPITYNKNWVWISLHVHPSYLWHSQWGLQCKTLFTRRNNPCIHPIYKILFIIPQKHIHVTGNNRVRTTGKDDSHLRGRMD